MSKEAAGELAMQYLERVGIPEQAEKYPGQGGFLPGPWTASRRVLAWRLSNTMDTEFCLAALAEAGKLRHSGDLQHRSGQPVHQ